MAYSMGPEIDSTISIGNRSLEAAMPRVCTYILYAHCAHSVIVDRPRETRKTDKVASITNHRVHFFKLPTLPKPSNLAKLPTPSKLPTPPKLTSTSLLPSWPVQSANDTQSQTSHPKKPSATPPSQTSGSPKIKLSAHETWDNDVALSAPPFPFEQSWDPASKVMHARERKALGIGTKDLLEESEIRE
jgi:hypothetical protein